MQENIFNLKASELRQRELGMYIIQSSICPSSSLHICIIRIPVSCHPFVVHLMSYISRLTSHSVHQSLCRLTSSIICLYVHLYHLQMSLILWMTRYLDLITSRRKTLLCIAVWKLVEVLCQVTGLKTLQMDSLCVRINWSRYPWQWWANIHVHVCVYR